jgi:site-specific DNA-methyltransferase (adenine-specific)
LSIYKWPDDFINKIIHGDCFDILPLIPDESIDLICIDPPYFINYKTSHRLDKDHNFCSPINGDNDKNILIKIIPILYEKLKFNSSIYIFCSFDNIEFFKIIIQQKFRIKNMIVWVKNNWTAGDLKNAYGKQYELIIYANKGLSKIRGKRITDIWNFNRVSPYKLLHQNQKPLNLIEQIIKKSSDINDLILDCFSGSGTTAIAAMNTNRKFICIEKDEKYFKLAKQRIENNKLRTNQHGQKYRFV